MNTRRAYTFTVCIRDDNAKTYEFRATGDQHDIAMLVAAAMKEGRHVRYHLIASDDVAPSGDDAVPHHERVHVGRRGLVGPT